MPQRVKSRTRWPFRLGYGLAGSGSVNAPVFQQVTGGGNLAAQIAFAYAGSGSAVMPAAGSNSERITTLLNGRSPHFSYSTPADPNITSGLTVEVSSIAALQSAIDAGNRVIEVAPSLTLSGGTVNLRGTDVDVICPNSTTFDGTLFAVGDSLAAVRPQRQRWTGGNFINAGMVVRPHEDTLLQDVFIDTLVGVSPEGIINFTGASGTRPQGWARFALLNVTLQIRDSSPLGGWALYSQSVGARTDMVLGSVKVISTTGQNNRFQNIDNLVIFDSAFNPDGNSSNGMRMHIICENVWMRDTWSVGLFKLDQAGTETTASVVNALFDNHDVYYNGAYAVHGPLPNTGEIRNSTLFGGTFSSGPLTNGGGNSSQSWDGVTLRDHSGVGAIR